MVHASRGADTYAVSCCTTSPQPLKGAAVACLCVLTLTCSAWFGLRPAGPRSGWSQERAVSLQEASHDAASCATTMHHNWGAAAAWIGSLAAATGGLGRREP